jgi:hypothetical protein
MDDGFTRFCDRGDFLAEVSVEQQVERMSSLGRDETHAEFSSFGVLPGIQGAMVHVLPMIKLAQFEDTKKKVCEAHAAVW